jgi:aminopeptidase N
MQKLLVLVFLLSSSIFFSQNKSNSNPDKLRGFVSSERAWWDLLHYDIDIKVEPDKKFISGSNTIEYRVLRARQTMQIDLQSPMRIVKITQCGENLSYKISGNAYFIELKSEQKIDDINKITIHFRGNPKEAINPPWDGGIVWKKDLNQKDFIANANQSVGASTWLPCKDHPYDEPENGISIKVTVPENLMDVSNGRLISIKSNHDKTKTYHWKVSNPINSYAINISIGDYKHFSQKYNGVNGVLDCDYYVLPYNLEKAKEQFEQVPKMLEAFEYWFGPYPFYNDGYKMIEVPYLGMEHQSAITYGNGFNNGYLKGDLSFTGWGLKFDFIIIHESGHEWFANSITTEDVADMWIHEGFTTYSEVLYLDYHFGTKAGNEYLIGIRKNIKNDKPIIGKYNVNTRGSNDMYYKGANIIHIIRQLIDNDDEFRDLLRGLNKRFYHQIVTSEQIENYIMEQTGLELSTFFDQYLRTKKVPVLEYKIKGTTINYRYKNILKEFRLPVKVYINNKEKWIEPSKEWKELNVDISNPKFRVDQNFYIINSRLNRNTAK